MAADFSVVKNISNTLKIFKKWDKLVKLFIWREDAAVYLEKSIPLKINYIWTLSNKKKKIT